MRRADLLALSASLLGCASILADDVQVVAGVWDWPDQGLSVFPEGDADEGALVMNLAMYDGRLVAVGSFHYAGGVPARSLALWDGTSWSILGGGSPNGNCRTLIVDDSDLFIAGTFNAVAGVPAKRIAKWDGTTWSGLGNGLSWTAIDAIHVWDKGETVIAAGDNVAQWNGATWSLVSGGISGGTGGAKSMAIFSDGSEASLYVAGFFANAGGMPVNKIAKWNGSQWSPVGTGITDSGGYGMALATYDDGTGAALYLGGGFEEVGGVRAINIARWDGKTWSSVGNPGLQYHNEIAQLKVLDDGAGPALFAIGADVLQKWDGKTWTRFQPRPGVMYTAQVFPGPSGPALHVGGAIAIGDDSQSDLHTNIARFTPGFACGDFNNDGVTDQVDLGILLAAFNCPGPGCQGDADGDGDTDQADLGILLANFGQKCG